MLIVLLMPVVQMLLFGFAISTEVNNIDFAAVVPGHSEEIRRQVERMASTTITLLFRVTSPLKTSTPCCAAGMPIW